MVKAVSEKSKKGENTDFFVDMLDNVTFGGLLIDVDRTIRYCNSNVEAIFGHSPDEIMGKRTEFLYGDRRKDPSDKNEIYNTLEKKGFHVGIALGMRKDGEKTDLRLSTFVVRPNSGAVIFIEEDGKRGEAGAGKERTLQNLLDTIPDMIYFKDRSNRFVMVNKAHADAVNMTPKEVVGKSDLDLFPKDLGRKYFADDTNIIRTGKAIVGKIERAPRPDGGVTYVSTTKMPHYDEDGNIVGIIGITRNITEQMIAEEELHFYKYNLEKLVNERTKELEESNERLARMYKLKSEFTSIVTHELRTPLTIMKEGISLVEDGTLGELNENQKYGLSTALKNIERLSRLIDDVLDFSKLESRKIRFKLIKGDLNEVIDQVCDSYRASVTGKKSLKLDVRLDPSLPLVKFDQDRVIQVLHNLIGNALKFTEKGRIVVESHAGDKDVTVSVSDTGTGIRRKDLARVFEKFEQAAPDARTRAQKGTGLGLAICKQIIEQMRGRISVESEYGKGSKFSFSLPR